MPEASSNGRRASSAQPYSDARPHHDRGSAKPFPIWQPRLAEDHARNKASSSRRTSTRGSGGIPKAPPIPRRIYSAGSAGGGSRCSRRAPSRSVTQILDLVKYLADAWPMTIRERERRIAAVRRFNRFYTRQLGVLRKTYLDSRYSLGEARVLYEIASGEAPTASDIGRALDLDAGYLSRTLRNFEKRGLIERKVSPSDARQSHLALSPNGRKAFAPLERRSQQDTAAMLEKLSRRDQDRLIAAISTIEKLLGGAAEHHPAPEQQYILRAPTPGDFGWIVKRHAELYGEEYGWIAPFEGVCAQIVADFVK